VFMPTNRRENHAADSAALPRCDRSGSHLDQRAELIRGVPRSTQHTDAYGSVRRGVAPIEHGRLSFGAEIPPCSARSSATVSARPGAPRGLRGLLCHQAFCAGAPEKR
jgi:hypothetical protein